MIDLKFSQSWKPERLNVGYQATIETGIKTIWENNVEIFYMGNPRFFDNLYQPV